MIVCKVCGTENPDGTQYCESCGVELTPEAAPAPIPEPVITETPAPAPEAAPANPASGHEAALPAAPEPSPAPPPAPVFRPAKLVFKRFGALTSETIPLQGPRLVVGRFDASTGPVEIDLTGVPGAENISRRHAELYFEGFWKVRDLGSTNGVFIKRAGEEAYSPRLVEPAELKDGDEIAFGNVIVVFQEG